MTYQIVGVYRESIYSHNAIDADRGILEESLEQAQELFKNSKNETTEIKIFEASEIGKINKDASLVLSMAQDPAALKLLSDLEQQGVFVCNSIESIKNCFRTRMIPRLAETQAQLPKSLILGTQNPLDEVFPSPNGYWLKRGDFHALTSSDVQFCKNTAEISTSLALFQKRGVTQVILQEHIPGDVYKFYGVRGLFFECRIVDSCIEPTVPADLSDICAKAQAAAELLGLEVYGGDCAISKNGETFIFDMNDWPSFRTCRTAAAKAIAKYSVFRMREHLKKR